MNIAGGAQSETPDRPEPLVPAGLDLRAYDWFPLKHKRLTRSRWWLRASDRAKALSIELWCEAYQQVPCASLPDDDVALSDIAGFGRRDTTSWLEVKEEILSAWVLCSDGRWYHPTLAEVANEAGEERTQRREREREKKRRQRAGSSNVPGDTKGDAEVGVERVSETATSESATVPPGQQHKGHNNTEQKNEGSVEPSPPTPKAKKTSRGTRIAWDWVASPEDRVYATTHGFTDAETREIEEAFFDFWTAKSGAGGTKMDWAATWRTWVRNEAKRRGGRSGPANYPTGPGGPGPAPRGGNGQREDRISAMQQGAMDALNRRRRGREDG